MRRHSKNQETPIMLYNSLKIYMTNRSCNLLDHFFHLGICVSYDCVLEITKNIYENLPLSYISHNYWFPNILKKVFLLYCWKATLKLMSDQTLLAPITMEPVFRSYNLLLRIAQILTFQKLIYRKMYLWKSKNYHCLPRNISILRNFCREKLY